MRATKRRAPPWADRLDLERIRDPRERRVVALSVLANAMVIALAAAVLYFAPVWLSAHGHVSALVNRIRLAAIASVFLLPVLAVFRLGRWASYRENSVRLGRDQLPEIFLILERHCSTLGVDPPRLYVSTLESAEVSTALALARGRRIIVLGPALFNGLDRIAERADVLGFVLASELGRLALGHASWWEDLVLGYLKRIPILRAPLLKVQTSSRDRFAATLSPASIRGLALAAVGGDLLSHVDLDAFVRQVVHDPTSPWWAWVGELGRDGPSLARRLRDLQSAGFLDLEERGAAPGAEDTSAGHAPTEGADGRHPPTLQ